jgi:ribonuclease III-like protein
LKDEDLTRILTDKGLAQFGDSLINFAYSIAITRSTGKPRGFKVQDRVLAEAAVKAGLRKLLPRRMSRGQVANSVEALLGHSWLNKLVTLDEVVSILADESYLIPSENFARLAEMTLARLKA